MATVVHQQGEVMTDPDQRAMLEARNATLRSQVNSMLVNLERQTSALRDAQAQAQAATGRATSPDGQVTAEVNASGIATDLRLEPTAFDRTSPERLARSILQVLQQAAADARQKADAALAPLQQDMPDLPDLFPGAPALKDLMPKPMPVPDNAQQQSPAAPRPPRPAGDDDEPGPIMREDKW